jgi:hypothetical protein
MWIVSDIVDMLFDNRRELWSCVFCIDTFEL